MKVLQLAALAACACAPPVSGAISAKVLGLAPDGQYRYQVATLPDVEDLRALRTRRFSVRADSALDQGLKGMTVDRGHDFRLTYHLEDGVAVADDDQSLVALSTLAGLETSASVLAAHGVEFSQRLEVLYYPRVDSVLLGDLRATFTDNAAYDPEHHLFLIIPPFITNALPLQLNLGVLGHESGHAALTQILETAHFGDLATYERRDFSSMNEGVADLFGFVVSGEVDPVTRSVSPGLVGNRDLSVPADYTEALHTELGLTNPTFDPHAHGSYLARAVYEALPKATDGKVTEATRDALGDRLVGALASVPFDGRDALGRFANAYALQLGATERARFCEVATQRLAPLLPLEACP